MTTVFCTYSCWDRFQNHEEHKVSAMVSHVVIIIHLINIEFDGYGSHLHVPTNRGICDDESNVKSNLKNWL